MAEKQVVTPEFSEPVADDIPTIMNEGRSPAVQMSDTESAGTKSPINQRDLDIILQTYQASRLPPDVVPVADRVNKKLPPLSVTDQALGETENSGETVSNVPMGPVQAISARDMQQQGQQGGKGSLSAPVPGLSQAKDQITRGFQNQMLGNIDEATQAASEEDLNIATADIDFVRQQKAQEAYKKDLQDAQDYADNMGNEILDISKKFIQGKIDPNRWYNSRTTGQKVALGIGAFLNGFGGGTEVLQMMQNAVTNDIKAQEFDFNNKGDQVKNMYAMVKKIYGDRKDTAKIVYGLNLQNIKNQVEALKVRSKDGRAVSKLGKLNGILQVELGKLYKDIALEQYKAKQEVRKEMKLSEGQRKDSRTLLLATNGFNMMSRAFKKGNNTFEWIGNDEYTSGMNMFTTGLGLLLSGAAVSEREAQAISNFIARVGDNRSVQVTKMREMRNLLLKYKDSILATSVDDIEGVLGGKSKYRNKNFKTD